MILHAVRRVKWCVSDTKTKGLAMRWSMRAAGALALGLTLTLVALGGCVYGSGASPAGGPLRLGASADGTTIELSKGAEFSVALEGNPTTGFDWRVAGVVPPQLAAMGDTLESSAAAGVVGAGGTRVFAYTAATAGTGVLSMEYLRPWETTVPPEKTFTLTVVVK